MKILDFVSRRRYHVHEKRFSYVVYIWGRSAINRYRNFAMGPWRIRDFGSCSLFVDCFLLVLEAPRIRLVSYNLNLNGHFIVLQQLYLKHLSYWYFESFITSPRCYYHFLIVYMAYGRSCHASWDGRVAVLAPWGELLDVGAAEVVNVGAVFWACASVPR